MENGPFLEKGTSEFANPIAELDEFGESGSGKVSQIVPTLIKPMENYRTRISESIFCVRNIFLYTQKSVSCAFYLLNRMVFDDLGEVI